MHGGGSGDWAPRAFLGPSEDTRGRQGTHATPGKAGDILAPPWAPLDPPLRHAAVAPLVDMQASLGTRVVLSRFD